MLDLVGMGRTVESTWTQSLKQGCYQWCKTILTEELKIGVSMRYYSQYHENRSNGHGHVFQDKEPACVQKHDVFGRIAAEVRTHVLRNLFYGIIGS
jgi:hypothetical protein